MRYSIIVTGFLFLFSTLFLVQCGEDSRDQVQNFEEEREQMVEDLRELRDELDEEIEELSARIERAGDEADEDLEAAYDELRGERSTVDRAIDDLERATEDTWEGIKTTAQDLYDRVSDTLSDWRD
jgi:chromosome segregation ATPase